MTAINQRLLHRRHVRRPHLYSFHHFFSSADSGPPSHIPPRESESESEPRPKPSFSSYFNEVRATLQREPPSQNRPQSLRKPSSFSNSPQTPPPSKSAYFEEIRRNLAEFRSRSAPSPPSSTSGQYVSVQELYKRNVITKDDDSATSSNFPAVKPPTGNSFNAIKESLLQLRANYHPEKNQNDSGGKIADQMSVLRFKESLKLKPGQNADLDSPMMLRGSDGLPSLLGKKKNGVQDDNVGSKSVRTGLGRLYNYSELGTKLKMLRPGRKKGKWFSLHELSERLAKLREIEENESRGSVGGISFNDLRETVEKLALDAEEKKRKKSCKLLFWHKNLFNDTSVCSWRQLYGWHCSVM